MGGGLPEEVEAVVHRGLAADRDERFPDVPAYVAALMAALDSTFDGADDAPTAWIPPDPTLTAVSGRPFVSGEVAAPVAATATDPGSRRRWALVGAGALVLGLVGGYAAERGLTSERVLDERAALGDGARALDRGRR